MDLTQKQLYNGNSLLNQQAIYIKSEEIYLYIHYWGGETSLKTNMPHKHSFFEICYILNGKGIYKEKDQEYELNKGKLFLSRPQAKHQIISIENLNILFVAFEPIYPQCSENGRELFQGLSEVEPFILNLVKDYRTEWLWKALLLQAQQPNSLIRDTLTNLCCSLIFSMTELFLKDEDSSKKPQNKNLTPTLIHRAKLYIRDNLSQPLTLKIVADNLHVSSRHLSRLFTEELDVTFTHYVRNERINRATILLTTTDLPIKTISNEVGFETIHYFTTVFKNMTGVSPGNFKKQLTTND